MHATCRTYTGNQERAPGEVSAWHLHPKGVRYPLKADQLQIATTRRGSERSADAVRRSADTLRNHEIDIQPVRGPGLVTSADKLTFA